MLYFLIMLVSLLIVLIAIILKNSNLGYTTNPTGKNRKLHAKPHPYLLRETIQTAALQMAENEIKDESLIVNQVEKAPQRLENFKLIGTHNKPAWDINKLFKVTKNIRRPRSMLEQLTLTTTDAAEYANIVASDPVIAARILKIVNSAAYNLQSKINDIKHAVAYLGNNMVRNIAIELSVQDAIMPTSKDTQQAFKQFWVAGYLSNLLTLRLSQQFMIGNSQMLATSSLLSFIGNMVYLAEFPQRVAEYTQQTSLFDRVEWEQQQSQTNSAIVGSILATHWQLPKELITPIENSYRLMVTPPHGSNDSITPSEVLTYTCCRIAELMAFNNIEDTATIDLSSQQGYEYYYLPQHLEKAGLSELPAQLKSKAIRTEANRIICRLGGSVKS